MAAVQGKRFNWLPKASAWQEMQGWRAKRQNVSENFGVATANLISGFADAWDAQATGSAQITVNQATTRIQAAYNAKIAQLIDMSA